MIQKRKLELRALPKEGGEALTFPFEIIRREGDRAPLFAVVKADLTVKQVEEYRAALAASVPPDTRLFIIPPDHDFELYEEVTVQ
jgi:hypothetical protein